MAPRGVGPAIGNKYCMDNGLPFNCHNGSERVFTVTGSHMCDNVKQAAVISGKWCAIGTLLLKITNTSYDLYQLAVGSIVYTLICLSGPFQSVASPGFGARKVFTRGDCRHIVAVRLCIGQSTLKKINCCKSRGDVPQCPIAGDANDSSVLNLLLVKLQHV